MICRIVSSLSLLANVIGDAIKQYSPTIGASESVAQALTVIAIAVLNEMSNAPRNFDIFEHLTLRLSVSLCRPGAH